MSPRESKSSTRVVSNSKTLIPIQSSWAQSALETTTLQQSLLWRLRTWEYDNVSRLLCRKLRTQHVLGWTICDDGLEVALRSDTCLIRNLEGDDLLTRSRDSNLYTISIYDMAASSPVCLMSKATSTKSWLWHRRLSHLNFDTITQLTKDDLVVGLLKFKYDKDHLCSTCEQGNNK
ncbi:integrase, catalytic region, zinc finger, CCHC-type containing protein [Tanacetum coccineum]